MPRLSGKINAVAVATSLALSACAMGQVRVAFYNQALLQGNQSALTDVVAAMHDDDKPGFALPVDVLVFTEVRNVDVNSLKTIVANAAPPGVSYTFGTFTTSGSEDSAGGANAIFLRNGRVVEIPAGHADIFTGAGRNADRWQIQLVGYSSPLAKFYVYGCHLKASPGAANEALRLSGVQAMRANADLLPAGTPIVFLGDMNFYSSNEDGYQWFIAQPGNGVAVDPLPGSWAGAGNAFKHTQSPRDISRGLTGGGMDDRFDFALPSTTLTDGAGLALIGGTYRALGNDGAHYDLAVNNGNNTYYPGDIPRSNALADALFDASDHVPVLVDLQLPAALEAWIAEQPGKVIKNASVAVEVQTWNAVSVVTPMGVDDLQFNAVGSGSVGGSAGGTAPVQPATTSRFLPVNTSLVGPISGTVTVTSSNEAVQNPAFALGVTGSIVRASNASFASNADLDATTAWFRIAAGAGTVELAVPIHNFGWDSNQALLDVDSIELAPGDAAFSVLDGSAAGIGASPAPILFGFDTTGLPPGVHSRSATVHVTDEDIPGEDAAVLALVIEVQIGSAVVGDLTGDGLVNGADLTVVLGQWGTPGSADLNGDGTVDGADITIVLGNWS